MTEQNDLLPIDLDLTLISFNVKLTGRGTQEKNDETVL